MSLSVKMGSKGVMRGVKKGGAGGKFTFGKPGDELDIPKDQPGDPNYVDEDDDLYVEYEVVKPVEITIPEFEEYLIDPDNADFKNFKKHLVEIVEEFLSSGDGVEFMRCVSEIERSNYRYQIVKKVVSIGLDLPNQGKELVSRLLSLLYGKVVTMRDIEIGFYCLLKEENDLKIDVPDVSEKLGNFMGRAAADDILPPRFFAHPEFENSPAVRHAKVLLSMKMGIVRLETIWGPSSISDVKSALDGIIRDFFHSYDIKQATEAIKNLECPLYHHEVVKRFVTQSMDFKDKDRDEMVKLITSLLQSCVISQDQFEMGIARVATENVMKELKIDVPNAEQIYRDIVMKFVSNSLLNKKFLS